MGEGFLLFSGIPVQIAADTVNVLGFGRDNGGEGERTSVDGDVVALVQLGSDFTVERRPCRGPAGAGDLDLEEHAIRQQYRTEREGVRTDGSNAYGTDTGMH